MLGMPRSSSVNIFDFGFKLLIGTHVIETNEAGLIICSCSCRTGRIQRKAGEYVVRSSQDQTDESSENDPRVRLDDIKVQVRY